MTPLPGPLGGTELIAWRIDVERYAKAWDSGEGAFRVGGRWNGKGVRAVYCALDPSTAILEVAVHKGFRTMDTVPHVMTALRIDKPGDVHVVDSGSIPDPAWLLPGLPGVEQQSYGNDLLAAHSFIAIPSAVSNQSWNLVFDAERARGQYVVSSQQDLVINPRLHAASG